MPPQPSDPEPEKFKFLSNLNGFLTRLLAVKGENEISSRSTGLQHSLAQDIVYIVTSRRVKFPEGLLLPSVIKTFTNNTDVMNILSLLGHVVSYSILSKMHTENASFKRNSQMKLYCQ